MLLSLIKIITGLDFHHSKMGGFLLHLERKEKGNLTKTTIMRSSSDVLPAEDKKVIPPFSVNQALIAMELGPTDEAMLEYVDFFTNLVPAKAAYFLHVLPQFDLFYAMYEKEAQSLISNFEINEDTLARMEANIKGLMAEKKTVFVEVDVRDGDPLEELLKNAKAIKADLAVIGQSSATNRHGILAKNLVRKIACNALVIPDKARKQLQKILVPIDFSENSAKALQAAVALTKRLKNPVEIICLNVYEMPNVSVYRIQKTRDQFKRMMEEDRLAAFEAFIDSYAPEAKDYISTKLLEKDLPGIAHYLLDFAKTNDIDFITIGAKGHSKVERLLLGSVTEKLMSLNNSIPSLIVK